MRTSTCCVFLALILVHSAAALTTNWPQSRSAQVDGLAEGATLPEI